MFLFIRQPIRFLLTVSFIAAVSACMFKAQPEPVMDRRVPLFDLSNLEDGIYRGSYTMADSQFVVDIGVEAHAVKRIKIIQGPERVFTKKCGLCEATAMIKEAIETQSVAVDAYSGATRTTEAIMRAVEDALTPPFERP